MTYYYHSYTHIGGRSNNEDAYIVLEHKKQKLFVVADGLGGHDAGAEASGIVTEILQKDFENLGRKFQLEESIAKANQIVIANQKEIGKKMRTTVTAVYINDGRITCANVGDSRTYLFSKGEIVYQSTDHSVAQMAVYSGEIKKEAIRSCEDRNILTRAIGAREELKVDVCTMKVREFDSVLLCSDGFWEYVLEEEMQEDLKTSRSPEEWVNKMLKRHNNRKPDDCDNNTVIAMMKR